MWVFLKELALLQLLFSALFLGSYSHSEVDGFFLVDSKLEVHQKPTSFAWKLKLEDKRKLLANWLSQKSRPDVDQRYSVNKEQFQDK